MYKTIAIRTNIFYINKLLINACFILLKMFAAWYGCRHTQVLLMCLCFLCCYAIRVTMSVAIEAMTNAATTGNRSFEVNIKKKRRTTFEKRERRKISSTFQSPKIIFEVEIF